jgi:serine/threonine-protein kinase
MPVPDPIALSSDAELRAVVERALSANYEIDREIGRGGMGIVYRAKDRRLKRTVAVKLLPPELAYRREIKSRFLREAETAAQLNHPNVVPIYTVDEREGLVYFVMACVDGCTLAKRMADVQRFDIDEARRILREVAEALSYAHARGVVHRDIKPDNILLDGESGRAMVTDFGIARAVQDTTGSRLTATGMAIGTPAYMSPEQAAGDREIDGRSDLYSLGVVGYQMLAGELPFTASSTPAMLMKHIAERPIPVEQHRRDIPPPLAATVMTLLEKEPDQRFENAGVLLQALDGRVTVTAPRSAMATSRTAPQRTEPYSAPYTPPVPQSQGSEAALPDHWARWNAPQVQRFRRSFIPFEFVNSVIVLAAIFTGVNFVPVTVIWGIFMAFKYSKLWAAGYDWRDVFRQPRDRRLTDVASETVDEVRAVFDRDRRGKRRERRQLPAPPPSPLANPSASPPPTGANVLGAHANQVREAAHADRHDRDGSDGSQHGASLDVRWASVRRPRRRARGRGALLAHSDARALPGRPRARRHAARIGAARVADRRARGAGESARNEGERGARAEARAAQAPASRARGWGAAPPGHVREAGELCARAAEHALRCAAAARGRHRERERADHRAHGPGALTR